MERARREITKVHKLGRYGRADEIAGLSHLPLSPDALFIAWHPLVVDRASRRNTDTNLSADSRPQTSDLAARVEPTLASARCIGGVSDA